jgi:hypothetical protein
VGDHRLDSDRLEGSLAGRCRPVLRCPDCGGDHPSSHRCELCGERPSEDAELRTEPAQSSILAREGGSSVAPNGGNAPPITAQNPPNPVSNFSGRRGWGLERWAEEPQRGSVVGVAVFVLLAWAVVVLALLWLWGWGW